MQKGVFRILSFVCGLSIALSSVSPKADARPLTTTEKAVTGTVLGGAGALTIGGIIWYLCTRDSGQHITFEDRLLNSLKNSIFWDPGNRDLYEKRVWHNRFGRSGFPLGVVARRNVNLKQSKLFDETNSQEIAEFIRCVVYNPKWREDILKIILKIYVTNWSAIVKNNKCTPNIVAAQTNARKLLDFKQGIGEKVNINDPVFEDIAEVLLHIQKGEDLCYVVPGIPHDDLWKQFLTQFVLEVNEN